MPEYQKRILSRSEPRISSKWISCKAKRKKNAKEPKKCLKSNLATSYTNTQDTKQPLSGKSTPYYTQHNDNTYT